MVNVIIKLLRSSSCRLLWNREATDVIKLSRGLRQGDPLSLYLFVLCMERFSKWILRKVEEGRWRPSKASGGGVRVSHLFFADDLFLFAEAREDQVDYMKDGLESFCCASGQKKFFDKSMIFFSPNILEQVASNLSTKMCAPRTSELGRYLGHHILHHGNNGRAYNQLPQSVHGRLDG